MRITIELRRPRRRSVALLLGVLLLAVPAVVLAGHQFPDVPNGHPFHDEIDAIAEAGITTGFDDGTYRPGDPVTRQAMAAFMQRGFGRVGLAIGAAPMTASVDVVAGSNTGTSFVPVRQLTISVPGANNAFNPQQPVHLQGRVAFNTSMSTSAKGCPCEFRAYIRDMTSNSRSVEQYQTFVSTTTNGFFYSFDVEALFAAPPGPRTYQLQVGLWDRNSSTNAAGFNFASVSSLSAMTFPFGPTGTSDLSAAGALNVPADGNQLRERRREE